MLVGKAHSQAMDSLLLEVSRIWEHSWMSADTLSGFWSSQVAGLIYPAYATCKALDQPASPEKSHWLCYWLVFGGITAVEAFATQRFPGYHHVKLLLLLWLQSRRYQGARRLYVEFLRPLFRKARPKVDAALSRASAWAVHNPAMSICTLLVIQR
jgi:hypothetical protein